MYYLQLDAIALTTGNPYLDQRSPLEAPLSDNELWKIT
jgi:hypothetical protein